MPAPKAPKAPKVIDLDKRRQGDDATEVADHREQTAPTRLRGHSHALPGSASLDALPTTQWKGRELPLLKQRFVLEKRVGVGGMGTVYRAIDLRKVEARDRNVFVAVKVLNDDFREHPDAFIALQRESAKSQVLANEHIVSIFDFDKDGDLPFMTMEYLEGDELADVLRRHPEGLPRDQAMTVIRGMCEGLRRAHAANITHADFKPGNVFVTTDGVAKVLDFGIARAVSGVTGDSRGDSTLFDPGTLGALTPAYASLEMLEGDPPDPRDDIFALGIVTYLVLTGRHPYERTPADQAYDQNLRPARPAGLSGRQWRVLQRALALTRNQRLTSVEQFQELFLVPPRWHRAVLWSAVAALAAAIAVVTVLDPQPPEPVPAMTLDLVSPADDAIGDFGRLLPRGALDWSDVPNLVAGWQALAEHLPAADPRRARLRARVLHHFSLALDALPDQATGDALQLLVAARPFHGPGQYWADGEARVAARVHAQVAGRLADPALTDAWQAELDSLIAILRRGFDGRPWADQAWEDEVRARVVRAYLRRSLPGDAGGCRGLC